MASRTASSRRCALGCEPGQYRLLPHLPARRGSARWWRARRFGRASTANPVSAFGCSTTRSGWNRQWRRQRPRLRSTTGVRASKVDARPWSIARCGRTPIPKPRSSRSRTRVPHWSSLDAPTVCRSLPAGDPRPPLRAHPAGREQARSHKQRMPVNPRFFENTGWERGAFKHPLRAT